MKPAWLFVFLLVLALLAGATILVGTRWGIGASPDSVFYLGAARNLLAGKGYSLPSVEGGNSPLTHLPPLYASLLAVLTKAGLDIGLAARGLNAALFGVGIWLAGGLINRWSPTMARWLPLAGGFWLFTAPHLLEIHLMAWSEPLFLFIGTVGLVILGRHLEHPQPGLLLASAALIGLALLTRYAGAALIATGIFGLLLLSVQPLSRRLQDSILFGIVSLAPFGLWLLRNMILAGTATGRQIVFHPPGKSHLFQALTTTASWFLVPASASLWLKLGVVAVAGLAIIGGLVWQVECRRTSRPRITSVGRIPGEIRLLALFVPVYALFLLFSLSFLDANTPLDGRILSPVYVYGLFLGCFVLSRGFATTQRQRWAGWFVGIVVLVSCIFYLRQGMSLLRQAYQEGIGFNNIAWLNSATLAALKDLPADTVIYTNAPDGVFFHTQRAVYGLPVKFDSLNQRPNPNYESQITALLEKVKEGAVLVYFYQVERPNLPGGEELSGLLPLRIVAEYSDGIILAAHSQ